MITAGCVSHQSSNLHTPKCGDVTYNTTTQKCCGSTLYTKQDSDDWLCCGENYYNYLANPHVACCNDTFIDITTQGCCYLGYPEIVLRKENETVYTTTTHHCCNGTVTPGGGDDWSKCGDSCYEFRTQSCCIEGDQNISPVNWRVHQGVESCCVGKSWPQGYTCNKKSGSIYNKSEISYLTKCPLGTHRTVYSGNNCVYG